MKVYPYSRLQSENLKPLLFSARVIGLLSYLLFAISIVLLIASLFMGPETINKPFGGATMSFTTPDYSGVAIVGGLWSVASALSLLAFSGLCAAVVSAEYHYTKPDV